MECATAGGRECGGRYTAPVEAVPEAVVPGPRPPSAKRIHRLSWRPSWFLFLSSVPLNLFRLNPYASGGLVEEFAALSTHCRTPRDWIETAEGISDGDSTTIFGRNGSSSRRRWKRVGLLQSTMGDGTDSGSPSSFFMPSSTRRISDGCSAFDDRFAA